MYLLLGEKQVLCICVVADTMNILWSLGGATEEKNTYDEEKTKPWARFTKSSL